MHGERHDASGKDIVSNVGVPGDPEALENIQTWSCRCDLVVIAPIRVYCRIQVVESGRIPDQMISTSSGTTYSEESSHGCCVRHGGEEEDGPRASVELRRCSNVVCF